MSVTRPVSFEDTAHAFAYKKDKQLRKTAFIFSLMRCRPLVSITTWVVPRIVNLRLPFINAWIRNTIFEQFVGGESLEDAAHIIRGLGRHGVDVILDYGAEGRKDSKAFDEARNEFIRAIRFAAEYSNIPFVTVKITSLARFTFLERMNDLLTTHECALNPATLFEKKSEQQELREVLSRLDAICNEAELQKTAILIDAEESWIQDAIDALATSMMEKRNKGRLVVYNTIQLYRHDRLEYLMKELNRAKQGNYLLGVKLVRGAYMEKENKRALEQNYPTPVQPDKGSSDRDFNTAIRFCVNNLDRMAVIIASHNEYGNRLAVQLLRALNIPPGAPEVHFSQLYGMSDHITFNLAALGCNVSKYLPYGKITDVIPYLMRRAKENSAVAGQTSRELLLIRKERAKRQAGKKATQTISGEKDKIK